MVLQAESYGGGYRQQSYSQDGCYSHGPSMHMGPTPHMKHSDEHGAKYHHMNTDYHTNGSNGHMSSPFSTSHSFSHEMLMGSYGRSYHGITHSPMGSNVELMKHEYNNYKYDHSSMLHNPIHSSHQSAEWKMKSIEDDD